MSMRKLLTLFSLFFLCTIAQAQMTTMTGQVIDTDGIAWSNGSWTMNFLPNPDQPTMNLYNINGTPLSRTVTTQKGFLDAGGNISLSVYQNGAISPAGSKWSLQVCPNATGNCWTYTLVASGSTMNITSIFGINLPAPRFRAIIGNYGYNPMEAILNLTPGNIYYDVTQQCYMGYSGSSWGCITNMGGSTCTGSGAAQVCTFQGTLAAMNVIPSKTPVIDVRAFGAKCDGTGNDAPSIMSALASVNSGTILIPPSLCRITQPIVINVTSANNPSIVGANSQLSVIYADYTAWQGTDYNAIEYTTQAILSSRLYGNTIHDLNIVANNGLSVSSNAISSATSVTRTSFTWESAGGYVPMYATTIHDVTMIGFNDCISLQEAWSVKLYSSHCINSSNGINIHGKVVNVNISQFYFENPTNPNDGVYIGGATYLDGLGSPEGIDIGQSLLYGGTTDYYLSSCLFCSIHNSVIDGAIQYGVAIASPNKLIIDHNYIYANSSNGTAVYSLGNQIATNGAAITNNIISCSGSSGNSYGVVFGNAGTPASNFTNSGWTIDNNAFNTCTTDILFGISGASGGLRYSSVTGNFFQGSTAPHIIVNAATAVSAFVGTQFSNNNADTDTNIYSMPAGIGQTFIQGDVNINNNGTDMGYGLGVNGTLGVGGNQTLFGSTAIINFNPGGTPRAIISATGSSLILNSLTGNDIEFQSNGSTVASISSAGKFTANSGAFSSSLTAPTQSANDNSTNVATTAYVDSRNPRTYPTCNGTVVPCRVELTGQTTAIGYTTLVGTLPSAGLYTVKANAHMTTVATAGTISIVLLANNGNTTGGYSCLSGSALPATNMYYQQTVTCGFVPIGVHPDLQYSTTFTGVTGSPVYTLEITVE